ncbi:YceI family protein [Mucilaginibacter auburnensis]|uniref:YceI-like domain-containing protein n=1 Tax=Mucilaginibacter auburnensis TaxID=1457233 RepID=A0A2H9VQJ6_9SPHI|nr:YceI family protein [Mucilaginibacter auburnensis]PJJ83127.1 YceI-like domain-containing protein [Mucilaginibacter auburnensis]
MKYIAIFLLAWMCSIKVGQDLYACKNARITLFSSAPIEDIDAASNSGTSVLNTATGEIAFSVNISSFKFKKSLMQEHFNSEYLESDKYPRATFKGKMQQAINPAQNGTYPVNVTGELEVHGVKQTRTLPGTITVNNGNISLNAEFMVKCADHNIEIPKIVFHNIAESIKITVTANYSPAK